MRTALIAMAVVFAAGCSSHGIVHYSPYDLDRDGVLDARCPGMAYDASRGTLYGWRSEASVDCAEQAPIAEDNS